MHQFNIDTFRTALGGGVRPNQYLVLFTGAGLNFSNPDPGIEGAAQALQNLSNTPYLVTAASLPGQSINPAVVFYRGREVKLAGDRVFSPWVTTILNDDNMTIRTALEGWMSTMERLATKAGKTRLSEYGGTLTVSQLDRNGKIIKNYIMEGAWPSDISEIGVSFDANDQISTFSCTWQYQNFRIINTTAEGLATQVATTGGSPLA